MKKLIALLTAAVATLTSAWAATVTFEDGSTTNFTVVNDSQNAGNYNWNNCTTFSVTIPAKEGLPAGTKVLLKSIAFVKANSSIVANVTDTPSAVLIGGYKGTAVTTGTAADGWAGSNIASRNTAVYSFGDGAILTVGTAAPAKMLGITNLRACPTSDNNVADKGDKDLVIGINNDSRYQPLAKLVCEVIETTEATVSTDTTLESLESLTWSKGVPTADVRGVVTIAEEATLTISASTTLPKLTFAGAGTVKYVGSSTTLNNNMVAPFIFGLGWTGSLHLNTITLSWFDFSQFVGVDTIKLTGVAGNIGPTDGQFFAGTIVLEDGENNTVALNLNDGFATNGYSFDAIAGTGTLKVTGQTSAREQFIFKDATDFEGAISLEGANNKKSVLFGTAKDYTAAQEGSIIVAANAEATIANGKTWTARNGIVVKGTLTAAGDLGSVAKGTGEIIYTGRLPTQQNCTTAGYAATDSAWTGTVTIKNYGAFKNGSVNSSLANVENLGNANSKVKFNGVHAYLPNSNLTCDYELVLENCEEAFDGETAAWFNDNGYSGNSCTFSKLSGSGSFNDDNSSCCHLISFADVSEYTGSINAQGKRIVLGTPAEGEWVPANNNDDKGKILIASDTTMTLAEGQTLTTRQGLYVNGTLVSPVELATKPSTKATGAVGVAVTHDEEAGTYTYTPEMPASREEPCNIVVTSWAFDTYTLEDGTTPTLKIDGDTVIIPASLPSDIPAQWSGAGCVNVQGYDVVVRKDMNWKHNIGNTMTIDENVKVYFYDGNFLDGATVEGEGTLVMKWTKTISGSVTIASKITMDGGAFKLADGATLTCDELEADKVTTDVEGKHVEYKSGAYVLADNKTATALFLEAVENAATGDTVTLTGEVVLTEQLEIAGKEITIDLNGQTISYNGAALSSGIILVHNGAGLTITGDGTIDSGIAMAAVAVTKKGDDPANPAKLTVNGGTLIGQTYGISGNGTRANTTVTINGGVIKAIKEGDGTGIYQPQLGSLEVTGGTIQGTTFGIYAKSGSVSISGGTIKSTATEIVDPSVNNNGTSGKGYALVLEKLAAGEGGYANNLTAEVTGGIFVAPTAILSWARSGSERLTKFVADGVTLTEGEETPSAADIMKSYVDEPTDWTDIEDDDVASIVTDIPADKTVTAEELAQWASDNDVAFTAGITIPVNALIFNVAPADVPADPVAAADAILEDLASKVDITAMTAGSLNAATLELLEKEYPMANISLKEVTTQIAGEEATNTHLFTLVIELK